MKHQSKVSNQACPAEAEVSGGPDERDAGGCVEGIAIVGAQAHAAQPDR